MAACGEFHDPTMLAFGYAVVSLYWAAGGTALLATVGETLEEVGRRGGPPAIALGSAAAAPKAAGGVLALAPIHACAPQPRIMNLGRPVPAAVGVTTDGGVKAWPERIKPLRRGLADIWVAPP
jgi:hypothetical protein